VRPSAPESRAQSSAPESRAAQSAPDPIEAEIVRIAESLGIPHRSQRWRELSLRRSVGNAAELEVLARDLDLIEQEIEAGGRRSTLRAG
jgi:hypothetical protein